MGPAAILAVASAADQLFGGILASNAEKKRAEAIKKAAGRQYRLTIGDINARETEERTAATLQTQQVARRTALAVGSTEAQAAESGITGETVSELVNQLAADQGEANVGILRNRDSIIAQLGRQRQQAYATYKATVASGQPTGPSPLLSGALGAARTLLNYRLGRSAPGSTISTQPQDAVSTTPAAVTPAFRFPIYMDPTSDFTGEVHP